MDSILCFVIAGVFCMAAGTSLLIYAIITWGEK